MLKRKFFSTLRNNLKCAVCKEKDCEVRYYPNRLISRYCNGTRYVIRCKQGKHAFFDDSLKRKIQ